MWHHIAKVWKTMVMLISFHLSYIHRHLTSQYVVGYKIPSLKFGIVEDRDLVTYKRGLRQFNYI